MFVLAYVIFTLINIYKYISYIGVHLYSQKSLQNRPYMKTFIVCAYLLLICLLILLDVVVGSVLLLLGGSFSQIEFKNIYYTDSFIGCCRSFLYLKINHCLILDLFSLSYFFLFGKSYRPSLQKAN